MLPYCVYSGCAPLVGGGGDTVLVSRQRGRWSDQFMVLPRSVAQGFLRTMNENSTFSVRCISTHGDPVRAVAVVGNSSLRHFSDVHHPFESRVFDVLSSHASIHSASIRPVLFPRILAQEPCANGKYLKHNIHSAFQKCERFLWFEPKTSCFESVFRHNVPGARNTTGDCREGRDITVSHSACTTLNKDLEDQEDRENRHHVPGHELQQQPPQPQQQKETTAGEQAPQ